MNQEKIEINLLQRIPEDCPVALMIRRGGTEKADEAFLKLIGADLGNQLKFVASSTYDDCLVQAREIISAASQSLTVTPNDGLGNPSILINREALQAAESSWNDLGHDTLTAKLMNGEQIPGFNDPSESSRRLLCWMLEKSASAGKGISLFISHDIVMLIIMARLFSMQLNKNKWPIRFEGVAFWRENDKVICSYRGATSSASLECPEAGGVHLVSQNS